MPAGTTLVSTPIVRLKEDVEDKIYNYRPSDTPLISKIARRKIHAVNPEWTADTYRAPNGANAAIEGADATFASATQPVVYSNRTQIFQDTISVSGTAEAVGKYGRSSEVDRQKTKKMVELKRDIEAAAIGNPVAVIGTSVAAGKMRGLYGWIATNDVLGAGGVSPDPVNNVAPTAGTLRAYTDTDLNTVIGMVYENGGDADVVMMSPAHKRKSSTFTLNVQKTNEVNKGGSGDTRLQTAYDLFGHDFGVSRMIPNRVMTGSGAGLVNTVYVLDYDKIKLAQLRPFQSQKLAVVGDSVQWQILTEVTLQVAQESTLGAVRDLTLTGS